MKKQKFFILVGFFIIIILQIVIYVRVESLREPPQEEILLEDEQTSLFFEVYGSSPDWIMKMLFNSPKMKAEFFEFLYPYEPMYQDPYFKWTCSTYSIAFDTLMKIRGYSSRKVNLISDEGNPHVVVELCENKHWVVYDVVNQVKWDYSAWEIHEDRTLINLTHDYTGNNYPDYFDKVYTINVDNEKYERSC